MVTQKCDIRFTIINEEEAYTVETYTGEYKNLMSLISDKVYVENFGECGGCATCLIEILDTENNFVFLERNEDASMKKQA